MTPEQRARQQIDRQLEQAGWIVQDYRQMNMSAELGIAIREFHLATGDAVFSRIGDRKSIRIVLATPNPSRVQTHYGAMDKFGPVLFWLNRSQTSVAR